MKKIILCISTVLLLFTLIPTQLKAVSDSDTPLKSPTESVESAKADILVARLAEIDKLDKSTMSSAEKKDLRKEVRDIKRTLSEMGDGVYLSVGALILVIVLLVLLL
jgi:hypothetical protein